MDPKARLVVVEDNATLLKGLLKALGTFPELAIVADARDGETGLKLALQHRPDLLLLDLELPGLDGIEITRRVKQAGLPTEVLVLTSFDDELKVYEAMQAGASGYLVKRVGPQKIREAIAEVLAGGTVVEALVAKRFWAHFSAMQAPSETARNPWGLTPVELEVLRFIAKGLTNAEVGRVLELQRRTVKTHLTHCYRKMGVSSHVEAVVAALKAGLVQV